MSLYSDWLLEQARWAHLAFLLGIFCIVPASKSSLFGHIINPHIILFPSKHEIKMAEYYHCFCAFINLNSISVNKNAQKFANIQPLRWPNAWPETWGAREQSPPTNVAWGSNSGVYTLRGFSPGIQFPPLLKNQYFQILIWPEVR